MMFRVDGINKRFGALEVLDGVGFDLIEGGITVLLGPSGCGKTTICSILAGLECPDSGEVTRPAGGASMVFQEPRLLPWRTVRENVDLVLKRLSGRAEREERVESMLKRVDLWEFRHYYPGRLSGGMQRRTALARAFIYPSELLLLDEPFQGLDVALKNDLIGYVTSLQAAGGVTILYVTHDLDEAMKIGGRIVILTRRPARVKRIFDRQDGTLSKESLEGLFREQPADSRNPG